MKPRSGGDLKGSSKIGTAFVGVGDRKGVKVETRGRGPLIFLSLKTAAGGVGDRNKDKLLCVQKSSFRSVGETAIVGVKCFLELSPLQYGHLLK